MQNGAWLRTTGLDSGGHTLAMGSEGCQRSLFPRGLSVLIHEMRTLDGTSVSHTRSDGPLVVPEILVATL